MITKEGKLAETTARLTARREFYAHARPLEVLAAKNATLRLRAPGGHIFSFTDLTSANGAVNFGHLNPSIDPFEALTSRLASPFYPPSACAYARWLLDKLGLDAHTVVYQIGEEAAVSAAVAIARRLRPGKIPSIYGSSHGALTSNFGHGSSGHDLDAHNQHPGIGESVVQIAAGSDFSAWHEISCVLYEPIQAACGFVPLPLPWLRGLSQAAQAAGALVIADETQCGFYRFGKVSLAASEYLRPDLYLFANSMTNGIYPLAAVVYPEGIRRVEEESSKPAFQTSSLGLQAAEAVARFIDSSEIETQVAQIHSLLSDTGEKLAANPSLSDLHLAGPTLSLGVRDGRAAELVRRCEERGVLLSFAGRRVRISPPVTIPIDQLTNALNVLEQAAKGL
jgi:acetylornithine/succinyldiaminopimelate/putrescine aminotransferase